MSSQSSKTRPPRQSQLNSKKPDPYVTNYTSPLKPASQQAAADYMALPMIGEIKEKGFSVSSNQWNRVSVPQPRVTPFPVARHRSEGPHWAPAVHPVVHQSEPAEEDSDKVDRENLAANAQPLERKKKADINLSRWKEHSNSVKDTANIARNYVKSPEVEGDQSRQIDNKMDFVPLYRDHKDEIDNTDELGYSDEALCKQAPSNKKESVASNARMKSSEACRDTGDGNVVTGNTDFHGNKSRADIETEEIEATNWSTLRSMTDQEIAAAQSDLAERLRPDILDLLRRRGMEKAMRCSGNKKDDAHRVVSQEHAMSSGGSEVELSEHLTVPEISKDITSENRNQKHVQVAAVAARQDTDCSISEASPTVAQMESQKNSWSDRVEAVRLLKFGLDGNVIGVSSEATTTSTAEVNQWGTHNVTERDILRTDGNPAAEGYTIKEVVALARSMVPAQRSAALRLLAMVLDKASSGLQVSDRKNNSASALISLDDIDWQAVWAYALGPEPELSLTLRIALDDSHATVVVTCAKVLQCLLSSSANESYFNLCELVCPRYGHPFTAPIFRKPPSQDQGLLGGCHWKYNVKSSDMFPFSSSSDSQNSEGDATVKDDAAIANQDVAAGLIRMGILPRIRYILEVENLIAAEIDLLGVLIALARHSPAAADAVMKCPRLLTTILQLFHQNGDMTSNFWPARPKAIRLLKVLCLAKKSNCIQIVEMGLFQAAQLGLLHQGLTLSTRGTAFQPPPGSSMGIIESLKLWRVCVNYQLGISFFSDFYPAILFWISPPSVHYMQTSMDFEKLALAEGSFLLLEALASTLPVLHGVSELDDQQQIEFIDSEPSANGMHNWSWKYAIPVVETSLTWLSSEIIFTCMMRLRDESKSENVAVLGGGLFLRIISSVLHFLSTLCGRILNKPVRQAGDSELLWIPTFVPKLGSQLVRSGLVDFMKTTVNNSTSLLRDGASYLDFFLSFEGYHGEALLTATNCLHGLVRLMKILDCLLESARMNKSSAILHKSNDSIEAEEILTYGLLLSAEGELMKLLTFVGNDVIQKSRMFEMVDISRRGGPAPGVGLGWGCPGGGYWSCRVLTAQTEAVLVTELTEIFSVKHGTNPFDRHALWQVKVGLSVSVLAGPGSADLVGRIWSFTIFHAGILSFVLEQADMFLRRWRWNLQTGEYLQEREGSFMDLDLKIEEIAHNLLQHFISVWLGRKLKAIKSEGHEYSNHANEAKKKRWSSSLSAVPEGGESFSAHHVGESLLAEWAGQRLPLPSQWLLSSLSGDMGFCQMSSGKPDGFYELSNEGEQSADYDSLEVISCKMEVIRHGLLLLCGFEAVCQLSPELEFSIPLARKIHALSTIYVLSDDVFLEDMVRNMIGSLQELYGNQLDCSSVQNQSLNNLCVGEQYGEQPWGKKYQHLLDFEGLVDERYSVFAEQLSNQFAAVSFGDLVFGRQIAIYLRRDVAGSLRLRVWKVLENEHVLDLLPSLEQCCGHFTGYLYPFEENQEILKSYVSAWVSGALDRARARNSVSFCLAIFHVAAFIFLGREKDEKILLRKTLAKSLVLGVTRRQQLQESLQQLVRCNVRAITSSSSLDIETILQPPTPQEIALRCLFLNEVCAGLPELLAEVQQLEKLVSSQD